LAVLGVLVAHMGTGPFVAGLRAVGPGPVAMALALVAGSTVCTAARWRWVARGFGVELGFREAVAAYYRSQFLNSTLPGGVLGDVHRGLAHRTLRSVATERVAGQSVQVAVSLLVVLVAWPSGAELSTTPLALAAVASVLVAAVLLGVLVARGILDVRVLPAVIGTSALATACHTTVFLVAARAVGVEAGTTTIVPIALAVLVVAAVPLNVAGWGPREGAAAWAFAAVGLGAATGATVATTYGVLALVATLPGAVLLLTGRRHEADATRPTTSAERESVGARG
jgi:uncharacterized membrane protein YbhN (UPF0104 family)